VTVITVFDGEKGWISVNGQVKDADDKVLEELKEAAYMMKAGRLTKLLEDKDLKISPLGEAKVDGKDAIGLKVACEKHRDYNIYFDKKTGLPVRIERRVHDFMSGQEVNEERIIKEYTEVEGVKMPKKVELLRDGKKFMNVEVQEVKFLDTVDKSEFEKP